LESRLPAARESNGSQLSTNTAIVYDYLKEHGASFFNDIVTAPTCSPAWSEEGLGELVFRGLVTADSFTGLRALITPLSKTTHRQVEMRRRRKKQVYSMDDAGRWVRLRRESSTTAPLNGNLAIDRDSIEASSAETAHALRSDFP
jgi:ATP-dependent Lhr-like helicase